MTLSARLLVALVGTYLLALLTGQILIPLLRRLKAGQVVRTEGPRTHLAKAGTPVMGGLIFAIPAVLFTLALAPREPSLLVPVLVALAVALGHGLIGLADDYLKVVLHRPLGLKAREKLLGQVLLALGLAWAAADLLGLGTDVRVPFTGAALPLGSWYYVLIVLVVLGTGNAVNLTDGADGLLAGSAVAVFGFYSVVALLRGQGGLAILSAAIGAGSLAFLYYNRHPAQVFMGDVGSLFLGGALAALAVLTRTELLLPVAGVLYVVETLSVILQVASFRLTGKRILRMSPLHHHFELAGWPEPAVVRRLWLASVVGVALAWLGLGAML